MDKQQLQNIFNKLLDEAFIALAEVTNKTKEQSEKLVSLTSEYISLQDTIYKAKKNIVDEKRSLEIHKIAHDDKVINFNNQVNKFNKSKKDYEDDFVKNASQRNKILDDINTLEEVLTSLDLKIKSKSIINEELTSLNNQLKEKKSELIGLGNEYSSLQSSIKKLQFELQDMNKEIEKQKSIVLPTISSLNEREKLVAKREGDLQVIIDRYKKLYSDKGVGFKV